MPRPLLITLLSLLLATIGEAQQDNRVLLFANYCEDSFSIDVPGASGVLMGAGYWGTRTFRATGVAPVVVSDGMGWTFPHSTNTSVIVQGIQTPTRCEVRIEPFHAEQLATWAENERASAESRLRTLQRKRTGAYVLGVLAIGAGVAAFPMDESLGPTLGIGGVVTGVALGLRGHDLTQDIDRERYAVEKFHAFAQVSRSVPGRP